MTAVLYPSVLQESLIRRLRELSRQRDQRLDGINTRAGAQAYVAGVRRRIRRCFGPLPKRTPLNVRITREDEREGYTRRNIIFESRPGYMVTACMYVPAGQGKAPVVLAICGHSHQGKGRDIYQSLCIGLVKQGYLVLMTDPVSQGERWQHPGEVSGKTWTGKSSVCEHNAIGKTQSLVGEFFGTWRVWDNMRGLDVLLDHPRADKSRVGVTGCSGGGTLSSYMFALDDRINMAAPCCYITTFLNNLENSLPCDAEQMIPGMLASGLEMGDLLLARAPLPVCVLAEEYDFFDVRGAREFYRQARRLYSLLGKPGNIKLAVGGGGHNYSRPMREAMYSFFNKQTGIASKADEDRIGIVPEPEQNTCAAGGDVNAAGSRPAWEFTAAKARELAATRPRLSKQSAADRLRKVLRLPARKAICHYRNSQPLVHSNEKPGAALGLETHYVVETGDALAVICRFLPLSVLDSCFNLAPPRDVELFIPGRSALDEVDVLAGTVMGKRLDEAWLVEPRGLGNTMPKSLSNHAFDASYGMDYMIATTYEMLDGQLMGMRVHDVLCVLDLLAARGARRITLTGRGLGAIIAAFAGALHGNVAKVNVIDPPPSYFDMTQKPLTAEGAQYMVRGILKYFDWTDFLPGRRRPGRSGKAK